MICRVVDGFNDWAGVELCAILATQAGARQA